MDKVSVLGVNFDNVNMQEAVDRCSKIMVGVTRFERATSWSRTKRSTN